MIIDNANERSLCTRLAIYLECRKRKYDLEGYYADTEYNRNQGGRIKTISGDIRITCDLILHSRGEIVSHDNLIAVEMKKASHSTKTKNKDRQRLRALTKASFDDIWSADGKTLPEHVCGYEVGFLIVLDIPKEKFTVEEYRSGELVNSWDDDF